PAILDGHKRVEARSSRRARSAAVMLVSRRAVAASVGQSGMRVQIDITFECTRKSTSSRAAGRAVVRGRGAYPFFDGVSGLRRGLSNVQATAILFIHFGSED